MSGEPLPKRLGPRPQTHQGMPHAQIGVTPELHPIAEHVGLPGLVMLYTPRTLDEADVVLALVTDAYRYVTGRPLQM